MQRFLVIDLKQAYLLKLFSASAHFSKLYPGPNDKHIKIFIPRGTWSLLDKDLSKFSERQLEMDYPEWQKEFLTYPNAIDYRDVASHQKELVFYCSDFNLQNLIDVKPNPGSSYIRSLTEPFDLEMELKAEQIRNWFEHFGVISKNVTGIRYMYQVMVIVMQINACNRWCRCKKTNPNTYYS